MAGQILVLLLLALATIDGGWLNAMSRHRTATAAMCDLRQAFSVDVSATGVDIKKMMSEAERQTRGLDGVAIATLILLRHGTSVWNGPNARFTGWCDVPLTVQGRVEAVRVGQLLRSRGFCAANVDVVFTSELQRAYESCELALASMAGNAGSFSSERIRRDMIPF